MVCSNYDPDPRKNVFKIGIVYRPESIVCVFNSTRPQGCVKRNNKVIFKEKGEGWVCRRKTIVLYVGCIQNFKNRKFQYKLSASYG